MALVLALAAPAIAQKASDKDRVPVRGTSIAMVPPAGFSPSTTFTGFEHAATGSAFKVVEFSRDAYKTMMKELTDEELAGQGITIASRTKVTIGGARGLLLTGTQTTGKLTMGRWILILGARSNTVMITVQDLSLRMLDDETVVETLKSVRFRTRLSLKQRVAELPVAFGDLAGFKVAYVAAGMGAALVKRSSRPDDLSQPVVIVSWPSDAPYQTQDGPLTLSQSMLRAVGSVTYSRFGQMSKVQVAGDDGYELSAEAKDNLTGRKVTVTQWLQLRPRGQVRVVAIVAPRQHAKLLPALRKLAAGLQVR